VVSSYALDDGERVLLFDPLAMPREIGERATGARTTDRAALERALA